MTKYRVDGGSEWAQGENLLSIQQNCRCSLLHYSPHKSTIANNLWWQLSIMAPIGQLEGKAGKTGKTKKVEESLAQLKR